MNRKKIYIGERIAHLPVVELLNHVFDVSFSKNVFGENHPFSSVDRFLGIVNSTDMADFIFIPHPYGVIKHEDAYLSSYVRLAKKYNKKVLLFAPGDSTEEINFPELTILRHSQYKSKLKSNEIIMPAFAQDLSFGNPITYRHKGEKPVVSFCGWADTGNISHELKYLIRNHILRSGPRRQGLYFRKEALNVLSKSNEVNTKFIVRDSFGGIKKTLHIDPLQSRREYIENIKAGDFVLSPRGDGNYSVRFYEALSLARIPLLIDTDMGLPLENVVDYERFTLRVSYNKVHDIDHITASFYEGLSDKKLLRMQKEARNAFISYLNPVSFFEYFFEHL